MYLKKYLPFLRSPIDGSELVYENDNLVDGGSNNFPIINSIPRFVEADNYAESFGFQWNIFDQHKLINTAQIISHLKDFIQTQVGLMNGCRAKTY